MSTVLDLLLGLLDRLAERFVDFQVRTAGVLEPDEFGDRVDGGVEVLLREGELGARLFKFEELFETKGDERGGHGSEPNVIDHFVYAPSQAIDVFGGDAQHDLRAAFAGREGCV